ncbi:uncharacterized protein B0P05DRAFT_526931, partial [Gilbertella persicaria]
MPYSENCLERLLVYMQPLIWYPLNKFHEDVAAIEALSFSIPEERKMIRRRISRIVGNADKTRECPFRIDKRFPAATSYAYVYSWEYSEIFINMYRILDTKIDTAVDMMYLGVQYDRKTVEEQSIKDYNKIMDAFYDNLWKLKKKIASGEHIYTTHKFEKYFNLKWD